MKGACLPLLLAAPAAACPSCSGAFQGGVADGIWWGIVILLTVTFSLVGGFAYTLWRVEKRRLEAEQRGAA